MVDRYNESFINYLDKNKTLSCNWLDITDEYTYDSYGYNHSDCLKYLSLIKKQTTSVNQKLYKFTVQFDNEYYYYYANLSDQALKTFKIKPTTNVETEGDIPNVD